MRDCHDVLRVSLLVLDPTFIHTTLASGTQCHVSPGAEQVAQQNETTAVQEQSRAIASGAAGGEMGRSIQPLKTLGWSLVLIYIVM
jgi:hypothetical protein